MMVRVSMLLSSWAKIPNLITEKEVVAIIKNSSHCGVQSAHTAGNEGDSDIELLDGPPVTGPSAYGTGSKLAASVSKA